MIARTDGHRVGITGIGASVPENIVTNDDFAARLDTSDAWIRERTGIAERRIALPEAVLSDYALPAARSALAHAGVTGADIDLVIVATVTPDAFFPAAACTIADELGASGAGAFDLSAGCTGFMYALAQGHAMVAAGLAQRALVIGGDLLSKVLDWDDRSTVILFGDGAGAVVVEPVERGGFLGFDLGADGSGGKYLTLNSHGSRPLPGDAFVRMNGREVFKFATRVLVSSAADLLSLTGRTVDEVDVYVPHQANRRIIDHAVSKLGVAQEKVVINVDRYGNTSSGSIPLALVDAFEDGRLREGALVLMTGMGAGLTWGSALLEWSLPSGGTE
jgi:3-oxoacyl-[acyl-carrier-protein] synthase III